MSQRLGDLLTNDAAGRRAAQTRFDGTVVVEAGAGTGKTTTLVARILAWSLARGWQEAAQQLADETAADAPPQRVAEAVLRGVTAITFTEAGAAEMATRTAAAPRPSPPGATKSRCRASIRTCSTSNPRTWWPSGRITYWARSTI